MATYSTGVTATWNNTPFIEVTDLQWTYGGGMPKGRGTGDFKWTDEAGTLTLTCLGAANVSTNEWGLRRQLVLSGGGASLTTYAVCESVSVAYEVNGVTRYTVTFKLLDN